MFRKMISGISLLVAALSFAGLSATSYGACGTHTSNHWDCIELDGVDVTSVGASNVSFTGSGTFSHWYTGTLWCDDIRFQVDFAVNGSNELDIVVTNASSANSTNPDCTSMVFSNYNWDTYDSGSASVSLDPSLADTATTPTAESLGDFHTPHMSYNGTLICNDILDFRFGNGDPTSDPSYIDIDTSLSCWAGSGNFDATLYYDDFEVY